MSLEPIPLRIDGQMLQTYRTGEGPPVVLLHGGGVDSAMLSWGPAASALAARYSVYLADWPGYGASPLSDTVQSIDYLVGLARGLLDAWGLERPVVGGISLGGAVALGLGLAHPDRVGALILVDSYGLQDKAPAHFASYLSLQVGPLWSATYRWAGGSRERTRSLLGTIFSDNSAISEALLDEVHQAVRQPGAGKAFYSTQRDELGPGKLKTDYMDRLGELDLPVLVVHGAADTAVPVRFAREAAERLRHGQLVIIPNAGHWPQRERPEAFIQAILDYLEDYHLSLASR